MTTTARMDEILALAQARYDANEAPRRPQHLAYRVPPGDAPPVVDLWMTEDEKDEFESLRRQAVLSDSLWAQGARERLAAKHKARRESIEVLALPVFDMASKAAMASLRDMGKTA